MAHDWLIESGKGVCEVDTAKEVCKILFLAPERTREQTAIYYKGKCVVASQRRSYLLLLMDISLRKERARKQQERRNEQWQGRL